MNYSILLFFFLLVVLNNCLRFSNKKRCACSEYEAPFCLGPPYCSFNGSACLDFECKYQTELFCTPFHTLNRCKWNQKTNSCEIYTYQCSELTLESCRGQFYGLYQGMDCMWQNDQCKLQDCAQISNCDQLSCSISSEGCGKKIDNLDCSSYSIEKCSISDGQGNVCTMNNKNQCKKYSVNPPCSELEEQMPTKEASISYCNAFCYYDTNSQSCIPKECNHITQESECKDFFFDNPSQSFVPCIWSNGKCNQITEKDFENFDVQKCLQFGMKHYTWQSSNSTCKQCKPLVDIFKYNPSENPKNNTQDQNNNTTQDQNTNTQDQNNGMEISKWVLIWLALQI